MFWYLNLSYFLWDCQSWPDLLPPYPCPGKTWPSLAKAEQAESTFGACPRYQLLPRYPVTTLPAHLVVFFAHSKTCPPLIFARLSTGQVSHMLSFCLARVRLPHFLPSPPTPRCSINPPLLHFAATFITPPPRSNEQSSYILNYSPLPSVHFTSPPSSGFSQHIIRHFTFLSSMKI